MTCAQILRNNSATNLERWYHVTYWPKMIGQHEVSAKFKSHFATCRKIMDQMHERRIPQGVLAILCRFLKSISTPKQSSVSTGWHNICKRKTSETEKISGQTRRTFCLLLDSRRSRLVMKHPIVQEIHQIHVTWSEFSSDRTEPPHKIIFLEVDPSSTINWMLEKSQNNTPIPLVGVQGTLRVPVYWEEYHCNNARESWHLLLGAPSRKSHESGR